MTTTPTPTPARFEPKVSFVDTPTGRLCEYCVEDRDDAAAIYERYGSIHSSTTLLRCTACNLTNEVEEEDDTPERVAAIVGGMDSINYDKSRIEAYLPDNYRLEEHPDASLAFIRGRDVAGWTLDGYVLPRLASGLIWAQEVTEPVEPVATYNDADILTVGDLIRRLQGINPDTPVTVEVDGWYRYATFLHRPFGTDSGERGYATATIELGDEIDPRDEVLYLEQPDDERYCPECKADIVGNDPHAPYCRCQ